LRTPAERTTVAVTLPRAHEYDEVAEAPSHPQAATAAITTTTIGGTPPIDRSDH
jgi:hypothetical protein